MKPVAYGLWCVALVVLACGGRLALRAHQLDRALRETASANRKPASATPRTVTPPGRSGASSAGASRLADAPAQPWKPTPESADARNARRRNVTPLPSSPAARQSQETIRVRLRYHAFYAANGLTPAQINAFEQAIAGKLDPFANVVGVPPGEEAGVRETLTRNLDEAVRQSLGEEMVPKMRDFVATADFRDFADKLAVNTFHTETPLTAAQADRLVQACLACRTGPGNGLRNLPEAVDWNKVMQLAPSFLAPAQLNTLQTMVDMHRFDQEFKRVTGLSYRPPVRNF